MSLRDEVQSGLGSRYEVEAEIGRGGMAIVFLATDLRYDRKVAIKVLDPKAAAGSQVERFQREIHTVARLTHPHILPVLDSGELPGAPSRAWYSMPYVAGGSLRDRLDREGPLPVAVATRITTEAAEALDHAHRQGLIHRDVKPENVLLQDGQAVVSDFGIAAFVDSDQKSGLTQAGWVVGTAGYMSPEQALGTEAVDHRTDIFSLACVLYESLTGVPPYSAPSPAAVVARMVTEDPAPVTEARPAASRLEPILAKALARLPADRYGTAGAFAQELRNSVTASNPPVPADEDPVTRGIGPGRVWSARRRILGLAVGLSLAVVSLATLAWGAGRRSPSAAAPSVARPSLAILPFRNLSPDPDNAFFAAGIHEELLTQLAKVEGIRLIGRSSVEAYGESERTATEIAEELGVAAVLEGSVRRVDDQVRITVRLDSSDESGPSWAEIYERDLADIFAVQADVAARVVEELRGVLTPEERLELTAPPTGSEEAVGHYLRGHYLRTSSIGTDAARRGAVEAYGRAVGADSTFLAAWARLIESRLWLAYFRRDFHERVQAKAELDKLEALAPDSPEFRLARGNWYRLGEGRYEDALDEFDALAEFWPGDLRVMSERAVLYQRLGRWEESLGAFGDVRELDPARTAAVVNTARTNLMLRRYDEVERHARVAVSLEPGDPFNWGYLVWGRLSQGDTAAARTALDSAVVQVGPEMIDSEYAWAWGTYQFFTRELDDVVSLYGRYSFDYTSVPDLGLAAAAAGGREDAVRTFSDSLRSWAHRMLASAPEEYREVRSQALLHLALAEAYIGDRDEAVRLADEGAQMFPVSHDAVDGTDRVLWQAHVYTVAGRHEEAVDLLRQLLSIPAHLVTVPLLRIDLRWDPLREHPGFQSLVDRPPGTS